LFIKISQYNINYLPIPSPYFTVPNKIVPAKAYENTNRNIPKIMKKLLHTETPTVNMSILSVACLPVIVKNRNTTTI